jgi:uncharacterized membrane protein (TIGR02234 family)
MRERVEYALALAVLLVGAAGAVLISTRTWQTVFTPRPRPFRDDVLRLSGRTIDAAPTALALVALAGVIAVIATRRHARQVIGAVIALAGAALTWRSLDALDAISVPRARALVADKHSGREIGAGAPHLDVTSSWAVLSTVCGVLVLLAGLLVLSRGARWGAMSARYDGPAAAVRGDGSNDSEKHSDARADSDDDPAQVRARADATMWSALDRGDDPTDATDPTRDIKP